MSASTLARPASGPRSSRSLRAYIALAHSNGEFDPEYLRALRAEHLTALLREKITAWSEETAAKGARLSPAQVRELCALLRSVGVQKG